MKRKLKDEIKGLIVSKGYKMQEVAQYLGMSVQNLNRKLNEEPHGNGIKMWGFFLN